MTAELTDIKNVSTLIMCELPIQSDKGTVSGNAKFLRKFSSGFITFLKLFLGNIFSWKINTMDSFATAIHENPAFPLYTEASSYGWVTSYDLKRHRRR